ncbi:hypothetical protein MBLNU13_g09869t1 [Cladosporium sp. NU13]
MSLAFFKSLLFPRSFRTHYTQLSQHTSHSSLESGSRSQDLDSSYNHTNEKTTARTQTTTTKVNPRTIADATIGLSDGLTVPFALTAGLSTLGDTNVVIYGGLAELMAGSISMGLGGYLGARSEAAGYRAAFSETKDIVANHPERAMEIVNDTFAVYDFSMEAMSDIANKLLACPDSMVDFLMRFHHQLTQDDYTASRALKSGLTISSGTDNKWLCPDLRVRKVFFEFERRFQEIVEDLDLVEEQRKDIQLEAKCLATPGGSSDDAMMCVPILAPFKRTPSETFRGSTPDDSDSCVKALSEALGGLQA